MTFTELCNTIRNLNLSESERDSMRANIEQRINGAMAHGDFSEVKELLDYRSALTSY